MIHFENQPMNNYAHSFFFNFYFCFCFYQCKKNHAQRCLFYKTSLINQTESLTQQNNYASFAIPINQNHFKSSQNVFKNKYSRSLDLGFLNQEVDFLNMLKAMHFVWASAKNNSHVIIVSPGGSQDSRARFRSIELLIQNQTNTIIPRFNQALTRSLHSEKLNLSETNKLQKPTKTVLASNKHSKHTPFPIPRAAQLNPENATQQPFGDLITFLKTVNFRNQSTPQTQLSKKLKPLDRQAYKQQQRQIILQAKLTRINARQCIKAYASETLAATGFFSNSNVSFKNLFNHLEPTRIQDKFIRAEQKKLKVNSEQKQKLKHKGYRVYKSMYLNICQTSFSYKTVVPIDENYKPTVFKCNKEEMLFFLSKYHTDLALLDPFVVVGKTKEMAKDGKNTANPLQNLSTKNKEQNQDKGKTHKLFANKELKTLFAYLKKRHLNSFKSQNLTAFQYSGKCHRKNRSDYPDAPKGLNYYDEFLREDHKKNYQQFVKNPLLSQTGVVIFTDPEKDRGLVKQVKSLQIPTIGLFTCKNRRTMVDFPIVGNPENGPFELFILRYFVALVKNLGGYSQFRKQLLKSFNESNFNSLNCLPKVKTKKKLEKREKNKTIRIKKKLKINQLNGN